MNAVADASVAVKWFLPSGDAEQDGGRAAALLQAVGDKRVALREPAHGLAEVAAVLIRLAPATVRGDIELLHAMRIPVVGTAEVYTTASKLAVSLDQHVFDTLCHALALLLPKSGS
jgi:hypothetical protein